MQHRPATVSGKGRRRTRRVAGFSMIEMLLVFIVIGILVTNSVPKIARAMRYELVNRAAQVIVQDIQNGFALAGSRTGHGPGW